LSIPPSEPLGLPPVGGGVAPLLIGELAVWAPAGAASSSASALVAKNRFMIAPVR